MEQCSGEPGPIASNTSESQVPGEDAKPPAEPAATAAPKTAGKKRPASDPAKAAKRQKVELSVGDKGVFFTTANAGSAVNAKRELQKQLDGELQKLLDTVQEAEPKAARPQDTPASSSKPKFVPCTEAAKGTGFLKLDAGTEIEPSKVVSQMLEAQRSDFLATGLAATSRHLCRVLPLDNLCKPYVDDFRRLAQEVLPGHLGPDVASTTWALEFKSRNSNTLKKEVVLEVLDAIVPKGHHKVNLNDPAKCILVEVHPSWCGLSIVENWARLKKYNLHALTTPEDSTKVAKAAEVFQEARKPEEPNAESTGQT